jgi:uncharacterized protein YuzE
VLVAEQAMTVAYDGTVDALYVRLRPGDIDGQVRVSGRVFVDVDTKDAPLGVEILSASRGWDVDSIVAAVALNPEEVDRLRGLLGAHLRPQDSRVRRTGAKGAGSRAEHAAGTGAPGFELVADEVST